MQKTAFFAKSPSPRHFREAKFFSRIGPCESYRPDDSENVVLFERATFLTGVIAAQSQNMSAKLKASLKLGGVKKKVTATIFENSKNCGRDFFF